MKPVFSLWFFNFLPSVCFFFMFESTKPRVKIWNTAYLYYYDVTVFINSFDYGTSTFILIIHLHDSQHQLNSLSCLLISSFQFHFIIFFFDNFMYCNAFWLLSPFTLFIDLLSLSVLPLSYKFLLLIWVFLFTFVSSEFNLVICMVLVIELFNGAKWAQQWVQIVR